MKPGEIFTAAGEIELNAGRPGVTLEVANTGDRPIQVGSHYHFFEANKALAFVDMQVPLLGDAEQALRAGHCMLEPKVEARMLQDVHLGGGRRGRSPAAGLDDNRISRGLGLFAKRRRKRTHHLAQCRGG